MNDLMLSETLLADLYQSAVMERAEHFQQGVLNRLQKAIGFDRAWWGILSQDSSGFKLLSSLRYELPEAFEAHWQSVSKEDALASDVHLQPRTTIHYNRRELLSTPGLASLNTEFNLRQALCTSMFLPDKQSFLFISLFRSGAHAPEFSAQDIEFKQQITPHLYACWRTNLVATVGHSYGARDRATAFIDQSGAIVCGHDGFRQLVKEAWPLWDGGRTLPAQLLQSDHSHRYALKVERASAGGLVRLDIYRPSALAKLTQRERQIAMAYAQARSHKHIALEMQLTPATVRYYIQAIYEKLNLHHKAELVKLVEAEKQSLALSSLRPMANGYHPGIVDYLAH